MPKWFYVQPSKAELEKKRISEIVTKGDSVIITEYLRGDTALTQHAIKSASDSAVIAYKIGHAISKERRYKIARNLPLDDAYNFFLESGVPNKEISRLVSSRISETEGYDLLFYFATKHLTKSEVIASLQGKTTFKLVGHFPHRTTVDIWDFPYETFAKYVISSVKNMDDYRLAVQFFKQTGSSEDKDNWIEVLKKKVNI